MTRTQWEKTTGIAANSTVNSTTNFVGTQFVDEVFRTEFDVVGRPLVEENLLTGAKSVRKYEDARNDLPTTISEFLNRGSQTGGSYDEQAEVITRLAYDHIGNVTSSKTGGTARKISRYDELGYPEDAAVEADRHFEVEFQTTPIGQVAESTEHRGRTNGSPKKFTTEREYDEQGRLRVTKEPITDDGAATKRQRITTHAYTPVVTASDPDANKDLARVTTTVTETGTSTLHTTHQYFDAAGQIVLDVNALGGSTRAVYDLNGNVIESHFLPASGDPLPARKTTHQYDALGRLRKTEYIDASGSVDHFDYYDYYQSQFWDVVSFSSIGGSPNDYDTAAEKNALRLRATKLRQDAAGKPIIVQQPYAEAYSELVAAHASTSDASKDAPITLFDYSYVPEKRLQAVTTRTSVGPVPFDTATSEVTLDKVPGSSTPGSKISLGYVETRVSRQLYNTSAAVLLTADRSIDRDSPLSVVDTTDFLDSGFMLSQRTYLDGSGRPQFSYDALGHQTEYRYDDSATGTGLLSETLMPVDPVTGNLQRVKTAYDSVGNVLLQHERQKVPPTIY